MCKYQILSSDKKMYNNHNSSDKKMYNNHNSRFNQDQDICTTLKVHVQH